MLDNDTQLMVSIFQKVFQLEGSEEHDPVKYVKTYELHIEEVGQIFAYLGLAKPDTQSALGWKPTRLLMEIIAQKVMRRSKLIDRMVRGGPVFRNRMAAWLRWILGSITPPISPRLPA